MSECVAVVNTFYGPHFVATDRRTDGPTDQHEQVTEPLSKSLSVMYALCYRPSVMPTLLAHLTTGQPRCVAALRMTNLGAKLGWELAKEMVWCASAR